MNGIINDSLEDEMSAWVILKGNINCKLYILIIN